MIERAGQPTTILRAASLPWASALFEGRRHVVRLLIDGPDFAERCGAFMEGLDSAQWSLTGHFVADISIDDAGIDDDGAWLELSALTIEDW